MKRIPAILLLIFIICIYSSCRQKTSVPENTQNTIVQTGLFTAPSTDKGVLITAIPAGASVTVQDEKDGWAKVNYEGTKGWVYSSFIEPDGTAVALVRPDAPPETSGAVETVQLADANGRPAVSGMGIMVPRFDTGETKPAPTQPAPTEPAPAQPAPTEPAPAQPAPAETAASGGYNDGVIHALAMSQLDDIVARYDGTVVGFGTGGARDAGNCPEQTRRYQQQMAGYNVTITGDESRKVVYLSFPMGWEKAPNTETVLNVLAQKGVKATFYVTHEYASKNPDIIRRIIAEGHDIGSHGYSHPTGGIAYLSVIQQMQDAVSMQDYMRSTFGYTMHKYNFNSSAWSHQGIATMTSMGYRVCFYSYNYADYDVSNQLPVEQVLSDMIGALFPGCIYYLHTVSDSNTQALSAFIDAARARGYDFGTF